MLRNLWLQKMFDKRLFFTPSKFYLSLDPRSEIRDPGWVKIRIWDKHPGSATLGTGTLIVTQKGKDNMENLRIIPLNILL